MSIGWLPVVLRHKISFLTKSEYCSNKANLAISFSVLAILFVCPALSKDVVRSSKTSANRLKVWTLEQKGHAGGNFTVNICPEAICIRARDFDFYIVSRAPLWDVYAYNPKAKTYFKWRLDQYDGLRKDMIFASWLRDYRWVKFGKSFDKKSKLSLLLYKVDTASDTVYGESIKAAVLSGAADIPVSASALRVHCRTVKVPQVKELTVAGDIPRSLFGLRSNGAYFATYSAKPEIIDGSHFDLPKGYNLVATDTLVSGGGDAGFAELIPDLDLKDKKKH